MSGSDSDENGLEPRTIRFKTYYWTYEETDDHELFIHVAGRTEDEKSVHCLIKGFTPFVYLKLPKRISWNKAKCIAVFEYLKKVMKSEGPQNYWLLKKYLLKYKKLCNTMCLTFPTNKAAYSLSRKCSNRTGMVIDGVGTFRQDEFEVHEQNIDPILKFTASKKLDLAGWIEVKETISEDDQGLGVEDRKFTTADIDLQVNWTDVEAYKPKEIVIVRPQYLSFDIECNSKNHNSKIPDPEIPENYVFQIACTIGKFGEPIEKSYLLSFGNPLDIPGTTVVRFNKGTMLQREKELLLYFSKLICDVNPDLFVTYNGTKFDWDYMIKRAEKLGIYMKFAQISRVIGRRAELKKISWSSSAYKEQEFRYLDPYGRTNVDVLVEIERNYKLAQYGLNAVAEFFLKEHKDDVTPRQLFMLFQLTEELTPIVEELEDGIVPRNKRIEIKERVQTILQMRRCHGEVKKLRTDLMAAKTGVQFNTLVRKAFSITGKYCVQDTILPVKIAEKLNLWITMEEMSNCMSVPMSYLHTRGQQIKVLSQIFRETIFNDIIIPFRKKQQNAPTEKYQGAVVIEANPGDYENVVCYDFESLYPTTIIAFNICYTTLLEDDDPTPDSECHVLEWEDHVGCLVKGTQISLPNRSFPIEKLSLFKGDVLGWNETENGIVRERQTNFFNQGIKRCIRLTLEDGTCLDCTPDHRILTSEQKWVEAQNLCLEDRVKVSYVPPAFYLGDSKYELAGETYKNDRLSKLMSLIGLLCSDGYSGDHSTHVYTGHQLDRDLISDDIQNLFHEKVEPKKETYGWSFRIPGKYGSALRNIQGMMKHRKTNQIRTLPEFLETANNGVVASFLSGLFGGDGHTFTFSHNAHSLGTIGFSWSSDTPEQLDCVFSTIQKYLKRMDIESSFTRIDRETRLHIKSESTLKFKERIGFAYCVHKAMRLEAGCRYLQMREKVWEQQKWLVDRVKTLKLTTTVEKATIQACNELKNGPVFNKYYASPSKQQMIDLLRPRRKIDKPMFSKKYFPGPMDFLKTIGAADIFKPGKYGVQSGSTVLPTFNLRVIHVEDIGMRETYDLEIRNVHSFIANGVVVHNCTHDPQKRKKKAADVLCKKHRYRFRKVVTLPDGTRLHEGLMPRLERHLLSSRKARKKDMAKLEATYKMATGVAMEDDIAFYRKMGWEIIEKGSLNAKQLEVLKVGITVRNAQQLTLKVSANSAYGGMGAQTGFIPLVEGAASVTAMGRMLIMKAIKFILERYPFAKLVYGDTDSSMITFKGKSTEESFVLGDKISKEASHYLKTFLLGFDENLEIECPEDGVKYRIDKYPRDKMGSLADVHKVQIYQYDSNPVNLQFENLYKRYLLLSKKRYVAHAVNRKGEIINTIKKGVVLARRDNCQYLRDTYKEMVDAILARKPEQDVMYALYDRVTKLFTRQIPDANLIIYTGVSTVMNYAKKKETKNGRTVTGRVFLDEEGEPIDDPLGPMDPRLVYPNYPQVLLSLKMLRRGDEVPPNTRLEYLYLENNSAKHQGEKAEDYTYYRENKDIYNFKPDYLHYVEKQLTNPITELLDVKYPRAKVPYEKLDDALDRCIDGLDPLLKQRTMEAKKRYSREVKERYDSLRCGWAAFGCRECREMFPKKCSAKHTEEGMTTRHNPQTQPRTYTYKGKAAQVQYILDSVAKKKADPKVRNEVDENKYPELVKVCKRWKSWNIINACHAKFGIRKRTAKRPTQTGEKLRLKTKEILTQVMLVDKYQGYDKGTLVTLKNLREETIETSIRGKKKYIYQIETPDGKILDEVPRSAFTTFYYKDGSVMKDILLARGSYKCVCEELKMLFSHLNFGDSEIKLFELKEENIEMEEDYQN